MDTYKLLKLTRQTKLPRTSRKPTGGTPQNPSPHAPLPSLWTREGTVRETLYYAHDLRKNVVSLFDVQGMRRASYQYDPYGNITAMDGDMAKENPYRFSSEHHDEDLGLVYYNYRHYNPTDGRWTSRDPIAEKGGWNLYVFGRNKAVHIADYLGLWVLDVTSIVPSMSPRFEPTKARCSIAYFLAPENREKYGFYEPCPNYYSQNALSITGRPTPCAHHTYTKWFWLKMGEVEEGRYLVKFSRSFTFGLKFGVAGGSVSVERSELLMIDGVLSFRVPCVVEYVKWITTVETQGLCRQFFLKRRLFSTIHSHILKVTSKLDQRKIVFDTATLIDKSGRDWQLTGGGIDVGPVSVSIEG